MKSKMKAFTFRQFKAVADKIAKKYKFDISSYNDEDFSIHVEGDVEFEYGNIYKIPIKFRNVSGGFDCSNNSLDSLEGCPESVGGYFDCSNNLLESLKYCPRIIGDNFYCFKNYLMSLKYGPKYIVRDYDCDNNELKSLEGAPIYVGGDFICHNNELVSLEGAPENIKCYWSIEDKYHSYPEYQKYLLVKKIEAL